VSVHVSIEYFGIIREQVPSPQEVVRLPVGGTVRELFGHLVERHGELFRDALLAPRGEPLPNVVLTLDGRRIADGAGMDRTVEADGVMQVLQLPPFIGGG
jgi:molybdopterin converting factor small subunit